MTSLFFFPCPFYPSPSAVIKATSMTSQPPGVAQIVIRGLSQGTASACRTLISRPSAM